MKWDNIKSMNEGIAELKNEMRAIIDAASKESRPLTDEEVKNFDAKESEVQKLQATVSRMDKIGVVSPIQQQLVVPQAEQPQAFRHGKLKAFKKPEAAYRAGQFFAATLFKNQAAAKWCADNGIDIQAALAGGDNVKGGYLVPTEMEQTIVDLREQFGVLRRNCQVVPMGSDTKDQPKRAGGVTAAWTGENSLIDDQDKNWGNVKLIAKKLTALVRVSNELNEDAIISVGDDLASEFAHAFAQAEDNAGFLGDGTATYGGVTGIVEAMAAGAVHAAAAGHTGFETLTLGDFEAVQGKLADYPGIMPAWFVSKVGYYASMARLMNAAGGNTMVDLGRGPELVFLGHPVVFTNVMNKTLGADASKPKAVLGDLRMGVMLGNRRGITVMQSEHRYFEYDQVGFRGITRLDVNVHERGTATAAGAIVVLKTPGA